MTDATCALRQSKPDSPSRCSILAGAYLIICIALVGISGMFVLPELSKMRETEKSENFRKAVMFRLEKGDLDLRIAQMQAQLAELTEAPENEAAAGRSERENAASAVRNAIAALNTRARELEPQIKDFLKTPEARAAYYELGDGRWTMRLIWLTGFNQSQLEHVLVMLMGLMGGFISLARSFVLVDAENPKPSDYFIRPLFGCVMAAVVYLGIKAGQFVLTDTGPNDPLNPYSLSLIAFVSGLMGQSALGAIERWGAGLFARLGHGSNAQQLQQSLALTKARLDSAEEAIDRKAQTDGALTASAAPILAEAKAAYDAAATAVRKVGNSTDNRLISEASAALGRLDELVAKLEALA